MSEIRCQDCGQPLESWAEPHSWDDCQWWIATQPMRDALVGISAMQRDMNAIVSGEEEVSP